MNAAMDSEEAEVYTFLKTSPGQFISGREVCRRAGGKWRYREDEYWAIPVLRRMVEKTLIESDDTGHYRLPKRDEPKQKKKKRWISPEIRTILQRSGRDFGIIEVEEPLDSDDLALAESPFSQTVPGSPVSAKDN
jgi:hypothetical protein